MNLENAYKKTKNKQNNIVYFITGMVTALGLTLCLVYLTNLLWNYVAPEFGLPALGYLKFLGTYVLITIFKVYFFNPKGVIKSVNQDKLLNNFQKDGNR